jgi:PAS domain S-box-containing protein
MRQLSHQYSSDDSLRGFIKQHGLSSCRGMVQLFSGASLEATIAAQLAVKNQLEHFVLIGASTAGEIFNGNCVEHTITLSLLIFEKDVNAQPFSLALTSPDLITEAIRQRFAIAPKVIIFFTNALETSPEAVLKALQKAMPDCIFAGGNAADNARFVGTYTLLETDVYRQGLVAVALHGESLQALQYAFTGWQAIGQSFTVTDADNNILYSLDNLPVLDIYEKYLGKHVVAGLPNTAMEFPFMLHQADKIILRSPVGMTPDGRGIILAGDIHPGDKVIFSFADIQLLMHNVKPLMPLNHSAVMLYSCAARKTYLGQHIQLETRKLGANNNAVGGFFYGEYCSSNQQFDLLNLSTVLLCLTEEALPITLPFDTSDNKPITPTSLHTLAHLATTTGKELNETLTFLQQHQHAVNQSSIVSITDAEGVIIYVNKKFEDISGYSAAELIGNTHQIIKHPAMPDKVFQSLWQTIKKNRTWQGLILNKKKNGSHYYVKTVIVPILNEAKEVSRYLSIRNDVTDIIKARQTIKIQNTDLLTGLPNRTRLNADVQSNNVLLLAVFDVRNFKLLNDFWGIEHGDNAIRQLGKLFATAASGLKLQIYKLHGASFAVRPESRISLQEFSAKCEQLRQQIEATVLEVNSHIFDINLSLGIGVSTTRAIALAESALSDAKAHYSSAIVIKTEQELSSNKAYECIEEVRNAINEGRLIAHFQRLAPIRTSEHLYDKFEALVRIDKGNGEFISPGVFLSYIKKTRLYGALTREILSIAMATANALQCIISVNLSIQDILDTQTKDFIFQQLQQHTGKRIIFEITESEAITEFASVAEFINCY